MISILFLFGTRPEAIKMAPLVKVFLNDPKFAVKVAVTAQHREMLDQVLDFFEIQPDYDLNVMAPNQTLHELTSVLIERVTKEVLLKEKFYIVFVQGDTTTVLAASLAAFYQKIKIAHVEAGLRSGNMYSPFPEEMNRVLASRLATWHFCPTVTAKENLKLENIVDNVYVTGNTVIDALLMGLEQIKKTGSDFYSSFNQINFEKNIILVTCHRRENFGQSFQNICDALLKLADLYKDSIEIVYPVHLNPNIKDIAYKNLKGENIHLIDPLDYHELIWMMSKSYIILTDSGGIQEEAPSLGKPVLVMREVTERTEGIEAGTAILVGSDSNKIIAEAAMLLDDKNHYNKIATASNPYGDGTTSELIKKIILEAGKAF